MGGAQDVFTLGSERLMKKTWRKVDIPKLISSQMSEKLKAALKQVRPTTARVSRPEVQSQAMKMDGYRLGTISEHAIGTAIDIESAKNAHIQTATWNHILTFTGKSLSHTMRQSKWKSNPKELYDAINAINAEFVKKLKSNGRHSGRSEKERGSRELNSKTESGIRNCKKTH